MNFEAAQDYLLDFLQDEFKAEPSVRVTMYPRGQPVHKVVEYLLDEGRDEREALSKVGVLARTETREYFFPLQWILGKEYSKIQAEVSRLREVLEKI